MNALVAKATYQQLSANLQKLVFNNTVVILERDAGYSSERAKEHLNQMDEQTKYSFFALAMLELDIKPISHKWQWQIVSNPYVALIGAEREIKMARLGLQREGIEVNFTNL
jgi:hypothetical protein